MPKHEQNVAFAQLPLLVWINKWGARDHPIPAGFCFSASWKAGFEGALSLLQSSCSGLTEYNGTTFSNTQPHRSIPMKEHLLGVIHQ